MVKVIAHRGKHDTVHENTYEAFDKAGRGEFYGIETDIHLTKDNKWITHHNPTIVSGGKEYIIKDLTYDELMNLPLDNKCGLSGVTICKFEDYLALCKQYNKRPIIELKIKPTMKQLKQLGLYIDSFIGLDNVTFISFYPQPMRKLQLIFKKRVHLELLVSPYPFLIKYAYLRKMGLDLDQKLLTPELTRKFQKKHLVVNVWTVDDKGEFKKFAEMGVDEITTNEFSNLDL